MILPLGLESCTITPLPASRQLQVRAIFHSLDPQTSEAIQLEVLLPAGDRSLAALQGEVLCRAIALLEQTRDPRLKGEERGKSG